MIEKNGIQFDINRLTRLEFRQVFKKLQAASDGEARDRVTGAILEKVCLSWPFPNPITTDGYLSLGLNDSKIVDNALEWALLDGGQKN